jgi:hypothetical protein
MSTLSVATIKSQNTLPPAVQNSSGTEIGTFCRAWVNFNGTGTVAIRASFNVSSITDNGTGDYTVNFTTAMSDANYNAIHPTTLLEGTGITLTVANYARTSNTQVVPTTSAYRFSTTNTSATAQDLAYCYVAFFR